MRRVRVRPAAAADLEEAARGYEEHRVGLGRGLIAAVREVCALLPERAEMYPIVHRDLRRVMVRRFPYALYFRLRERDVIIVAVFHVSRHPGRWRSRR